MDKRGRNVYIYGILLVFLIDSCSAQKFPGFGCTDSRSRSGVCTPFHECPSVQHELRIDVSPTHCGFDGDQPIVCCPAWPATPSSSPTPQSPVLSLSPGIAEEKAKAWDQCTDSTRRNGVCTPLQDCPRALAVMRRGDTPTYCDSQRGEPLVCCTGPTQTQSSTSRPHLQAPPPLSENPGENIQTGERCTDSRSRDGVCTPLEDCPSVQKEMRGDQTRPSKCRFVGDQPIVCCPVLPLTTPSSAHQSQPPESDSPARDPEDLVDTKKTGDQCTDSKNRNGVCTPFRECVSAQIELLKDIPPTMCRFIRDLPIVCCPTFDPTPRPQPPAPPPTSLLQEGPGETSETSVRCTDSKLRHGECTTLQECPKALEDLVRGITATNCGPVNGEAGVCCLHRTSTPPPAPKPKPPVTFLPGSGIGQRAKTWCEEYSKSCRPRYSNPGGTSTVLDEFPHMAAIGHGPASNIQWKCAGTLISEHFVLLAAHCLHSRRVGPARWVLLGTVNLAANETLLGNNGQIHAVTQMIRHPGYKPPAKYHDIALVKIGPALTSNPRSLRSKDLHPACLRTDESIQYNTYIATGWGRPMRGAEPKSEFLKVELEVFDEAKCNETYNMEIRNTNKLRRGIVSTMICAAILRGERDPCKVATGGPLQLATMGTCQYEVWGIASFGRMCSRSHSPTVYTKVSAYLGWIEDHVWPSGI